eukprot:TRINITY_DN1715_c0_g1_i1.p1 TRINITY_DN1715_c0_g1~~TRINITY_DN1715_c0_g1_i1.p1  ORF type:complete len:184 (-),score=53.14 TRINITY_DN1715_c0_g1_i1:2-505(-)
MLCLSDTAVTFARPEDRGYHHWIDITNNQVVKLKACCGLDCGDFGFGEKGASDTQNDDECERMKKKQCKKATDKCTPSVKKNGKFICVSLPEVEDTSSSGGVTVIEDSIFWETYDDYVKFCSTVTSECSNFNCKGTVPGKCSELEQEKRKSTDCVAARLRLPKAHRG